MKIKFRCIICTIIVSAMATTGFAAEIDKSEKSIEVQKEYDVNRDKVEDNQKTMENKEDKEDKAQENTRGKVYVCKPFYLDHFGIIKKSLKTFNVSGEKLATYIREGKKLEDVLEIENIPIKKFKKEVIKQYNAKVKEGVKEGNLTKEQAKKLRQAIDQTIKKWLD